MAQENHREVWETIFGLVKVVDPDAPIERDSLDNPRDPIV